MTRPRRSSSYQPNTRGAYARTNADFKVNSPDGFPSEYPPVWWVGSDQLRLGAHWNHGGWNNLWSTGDGAALPVVTRAISLITSPLTAAPFREIDLATGSPLGRARWITDPMALRTDRRTTDAVYPAVVQLPRGEFWAAWIRSAICWGVGGFVCEEDQIGQPLAGTLRLIDARMLSTERDSQGVLHWVLGASGPEQERAVFDRDGYLQLGPVRLRLVTLRNPHSDVGPDGMSAGVFEMHPDVFHLSGQIESYTSGTFRSGIPAGYLQVNMPGFTDEMAADLKQRWLASHGGDRRSIAVLGAQTSFQPLNLSPVDAELTSVKKLNIADTAFAFGLDPDVLGCGLNNSSTYRNATEFWQRHKDFGLAPWIAAVQDVLTALLPGSQGVVVDLDRFANPPAGERYAAYQTAIEIGILTPEECRALEGYGPLPPSDTSSEETRNLSAAEVSQKVYLAVQAGVLSIPEARQMIADAGGKLDVAAIPATQGGGGGGGQAQGQAPEAAAS